MVAWAALVHLSVNGEIAAELAGSLAAWVCYGMRAGTWTHAFELLHP